MLDHVSLGTLDLARAIAFYDAALAPLGVVRVWSTVDSAGYGYPGEDDRLAIKQRAGAASPGPGFHLALAARTRRDVDSFFRSAITSGGTSDGPPGLRPQYSATYYAAFVVDPDGHRIEAVCHK